MSTSVGGPPVNHTQSESVNGRNATAAAITTPTIPNGNNSFTTDHTRHPSMTVTPAGASFNTNGAGQGKAASNIQFGSMNAAESPALSTPQMAHQSNNLGVSSINQRAASPQGSPSPIPQPASVSGGRPPSSFQAQGNGVSFGQLNPDANDPTGLARSMSNMQFNGSQQDVHLRRGSSQSIHSDIGNQALPTGPGRGGYQGGRGRGGYGYPNQMAYSPHQNFRPAQNGRGMGPNNYSNQTRHQIPPYQGSPNLGTRSPMMNHANPGTPQMSQMHMMPSVPGQPAGYYMGTQVIPQISSSLSSYNAARGKPTRGRGPRIRGRGRGSGRGGFEGPHFNSRDPASDHYFPPHLAFFPPDFQLPDLSPESGNFEHFLTSTKQGYSVPTQADPSIQFMYNMNAGYSQMQGQMQNQFQYAPPQSPRPPFQQPGYGAHMQPSYSNQGPPSMSRQSSQMSTTTDRPSSSIGQSSHTQNASTNTSHPSARTPSMSTQKDFTLPVKKSAAIVIKNAQGEVVDFKKPAGSTPVTSSSTPVVPTPPSRTPSAADHIRADSSAKTDEEKKKAMQEAVAKKVAEEQARAKEEKEAAEQKALMDQEAAEAARREAEEKAAEAEALEKEAKETAANKALEVEKAALSPPAVPAADDEIDFDAIEAELAAQEAEEARLEEEYQKKKAAQREEQKRREQEEAASYEANMKEAERKAEEEELAREKKRVEGASDDSESKKLFAELKSGQNDENAAADDESPIQTPAESGAATPVSDGSMPPPGKGLSGSRRGKVADLKLDTKKPVEPPEPSATLKSLTAARRLEDPTKVSYPDGFVSPNPALNANAPASKRFKYNKEFLLQFQKVFTEKPSIDWDSKIREALGDGESSARPGTARTPSGMGGRSASNRPSAATSGFQPMGAFGGGLTLPPGTNSSQRFAASNAAMRGGPMGNPFSFGRPGSMGPPMGRTPSNNPLGGIPGSPRAGGPSRGGQRNESKRAKHSAKQEAEANKSMPLTAGLNVGTLETSSSGWKARSLGQPTAGPTPSGEGHLEPDVVQRKVKAALNKMTPEKFDRIADQILEIAAQSKHESDGRTLRQVIQLTFEKATDEAHWASMYALFCSKMLHTMSPEIKDENIRDKNGEVVTGGNLFRKYLLNRCQEEFERGWKINLPKGKEGEGEETVLMSDEYYVAAAAKRRGLGLVKFIGELFKLQMLTERIMHECVKKLVDYEGTPEEAEVESLCSLLRTIGKQLDSSESKAQGRMDVYFERIRQTIDLPELPSRLRFMLMDVVDLRKHNWSSAADDKGPKTITEIRETAEREAREAEVARLASQASNRGGRMPMGRGDARSFSGHGQVPPPDNSNRVGADDLRRLGGRASRNASSTGPGSLGPPSLLGGRTNSGRRGLGPGGLLSRGGEDSNASSRTGTPPAQKEKDKKDESSTNAFSALAALDGHEDPSSPPTQKVQPNLEHERSRSPGKPE